MCRCTRSGYLTELLGNRAVDVISSYAKAARPFFVSLHFSAPHWPEARAIRRSRTG